MPRVSLGTSYVTRATRGDLHGDLWVPGRFEDLGLTDEESLFLLFGTARSDQGLRLSGCPVRTRRSHRNLVIRDRAAAAIREAEPDRDTQIEDEPV